MRTKIELFDRVRINERSEIGFIGREGTVAFIGASGVNVLIEDIPEPLPLKWSEFDVIKWEKYGEEE